MPRRSRIFTVALPASGNSASIRQVANSATRIRLDHARCGAGRPSSRHCFFSATNELHSVGAGARGWTLAPCTAIVGREFSPTCPAPRGECRIHPALVRRSAAVAGWWWRERGVDRQRGGSGPCRRPIAAGQRTLLTPAQLAGCGLSEDAVAYRAQDGAAACGVSGRVLGGVRGVAAAGAGAGGAAVVRRAELPQSSFGRVCVGDAQERRPAADGGLRGWTRCLGSRKGMRVHRIRAIDQWDLRREKGVVGELAGAGGA